MLRAGGGRGEGFGGGGGGGVAGGGGLYGGARGGRGGGGEGGEDEAALGDTGVRDLECGGPHDRVTVEEDVDVDGARAFGNSPDAAQGALDFLDTRQQLQGKERRLGLQHQIQEPALIGII